MVTVGRIKNNDLSILGELNERLPNVTKGLVAHFPLDTKGGAFSGISGHTVKQGMEEGVNLIEAMSLNWRDAEAWASNTIDLTPVLTYDASRDALRIAGYRNIRLKTPIIIDPNKVYQISMEVLIERRSDANPLSYIGGHSLDVDGVQTTVNYDYTIASSWKPQKGIWHTLRVTRTGLGVAQSGTSTSFDNIKGWKGDGDGNRTIKYYHLGGLFNYMDGTGITYIRNLKIEVVSPDTSNASIDADGLSLNHPSTNLDLSDIGRCDVYNNHKNATTMIDTGEKYLGMPVYKVTFIPTTEMQLNSIKSELWNQGIIHTRFNFKANTPYANSIYWKPISHANMEFGGNASNVHGFYVGRNEKMLNGWSRYYRYRDGKVTEDRIDGTHHTFIVPTAVMNEPISFLYACPQIEEGRMYPTSYMKPQTSRDVNRIELDDDLINWNAGSMSIKFKPNAGALIDSATSQETGYNRILAVINKVVDNSIYEGLTVCYNKQGIYVECVDVISSRFISDVTAINKFVEGEWGVITVRWRKTSTAFEMSLSANEQTTYTQVPLSVSPVRNGRLSIGNLPDLNRLCPGTYKDFSVYNRYLLDDEVTKLHQGTIGINEVGDMTALSLSEKIIETDNSIFHFPLMTDTDEVRGRASATIAENLTYTREGVYNNGVERVNYTQYGIGNFENYYNYTRDGDNHIFYRHPESTSYSLYFTVDKLISEMVDGDKYTVSGYIYVDGKPTKFATGKVHNSRSALYHATESNGYFASTQVYNSNDDNPMWVVGAGLLVPTPIGSTVEIKNLQIIKGDVVPAYTPENSKVSNLSFSLHGDLGLNWGGDWSIVYWKKPIATSGGTTPFTGYSIDSLGSTHINASGGYWWWGKERNSDMIVSSSPSTIDPVQYFKNWRMISLVKSGDTVNLKEMDYFGNVYKRVGSFADKPADFFVSPDGIDLRLGYYSNLETRMNDSYFRDLIVSSRAFTDNELNDLFNKNLSVSKNGITVRGILKEEQIH